MFTRARDARYAARVMRATRWGSWTARTPRYLVERARAWRRVEPAPRPLDSRAIRAAAVGRRTRRDSAGGGGATRYAIASRISLRMTRRTPDHELSISHTLFWTMPAASAMRHTTS